MEEEYQIKEEGREGGREGEEGREEGGRRKIFLSSFLLSPEVTHFPHLPLHWALFLVPFPVRPAEKPESSSPATPFQ